MDLYNDLQDITKIAYYEDEDDDELDLIKLVNTTANTTSQYLVFLGSDNQYYAKNVSKIKELLVYKELKIAKNNRKTLIIGSANIRGDMTTIIRFDEWFGNEVLKDEEYELVILAHYGGHQLGIVVKSVEYIVNIEPHTMTDNSYNNDKSSFISSVNINGENELCIIIDSDKMLLDVFDNIETNIDKDLKNIEPILQNKKMILFADDSKFVCKIVEDLLIALHLNYAIFNNAKELLNALSQMNPNEIGLFITDLEMPVMGGKELIHAIRKDDTYKNINIIVHTNMANDIMQNELLESGANQVISKVNMIKLAKAIKELSL